MREPKRPVLAHGKVRHVGDAYAAVIAETYNQAKDAASNSPMTAISRNCPPSST
jgi:aerobic carbon-monoxide dehydrogenase large subunit